MFRQYHYLSGRLNRKADCYLLTLDGEPVGFIGIITYPGKRGVTYRFHRVVIHPNYQNMGLGRKFMEFVASRYAVKGPVFITSSHPGVYHSLSRSKNWKRIRNISFMTPQRMKNLEKSSSRRAGRLTASFRYVGPKHPE